MNSFYAKRLSLLRYPEDLLRAMRERGLAYTKARLLARLKDDGARRELTEEVLTDDLSVEALEERVRLRAEKAQVPPGLHNDFGCLKCLVTKRRVEALGAAKQRRLQRLMREIEALLSSDG